MSKREVEIQLKRLHRQTENLSTQIYGLERHFLDRIEHLKRTLSTLQELETTISRAVDAYREAAEKEARREMRELQQQHKETLAALNSKKSATPTFVKGEVEKAQTLAIFDSVIFAISNWSTDGGTAPDFELACQSVLFPIVYERVMSGDSDYYVDEVPSSAMEVVKRGREYVKHLREVCTASLVDPDTWNEHANSVHYGGRSDEWDEDTPLSLDAALEWRDQPASRALHFPLIFDGLELVKKHGDIIRETTGLPEFNLNTLQTRLQP